MNPLEELDTGSAAWRECLETELSVFSKPEWHFQANNFSLGYEIINGNVLHGVSTGRLQEDHIEPAFQLKENIISSMGLDSGSYFYVLGLTESKGASQKARKRYINAILRLYKKYPFQMFIFYGANWLLTAGINLAKPFVPFKVRVANDFDGALKLIAEESPEDMLSSNLLSIKKSTPGLRCNWFTMTLTAPLMMNSPPPIITGISPTYIACSDTSWLPSPRSLQDIFSGYA